MIVLDAAWLAPAVIAALLTVIGGIIVAIVNKRPDPFNRLNTVLDQVQEERTADREDRVRLEGKLDGAMQALGLYKQYVAKVDAWAAAGYPPPPPEKLPGM